MEHKKADLNTLFGYDSEYSKASYRYCQLRLPNNDGLLLKGIFYGKEI